MVHRARLRRALILGPEWRPKTNVDGDNISRIVQMEDIIIFRGRSGHSGHRFFALPDARTRTFRRAKRFFREAGYVGLPFAQTKSDKDWMDWLGKWVVDDVGTSTS